MIHIIVWLVGVARHDKGSRWSLGGGRPVGIPLLLFVMREKAQDDQSDHCQSGQGQSQPQSPGR